MQTGNSGKIIGALIALVALATAVGLGLSFYLSSSSIHTLLTENQALNQALANLTQEEQIGFATVIAQERDGLGQITTELKFVQTAAGKPREIVDEQIFSIAGDVVHFDALIVKFSQQAVRDGQERALYLWRRVYGEQTPPEKGTAIQQPGGSAPERYHAITKSLKVSDREVFWEAIWSLANDPGRLSEYGITAVFGNALYTKVEPGKVYRFKISATGQIYPEVLDFGSMEAGL
ncbi:MAG: hypothetical protein GVY36_13840 [Verrucomicrobia bacterium]|jgi:hypothetical protein|nr:hypothetical protein [Verrucomicrobiota bacterium]